MRRRLGWLLCSGLLRGGDADAEAAWWVESQNMATFLRLEPPSQLTLPVRLNVLLSGFSGETSSALNATMAEVRAYLAQLELELPHVALPTTKSPTKSASETQQRQGSSDDEHGAAAEPESLVSYRIELEPYMLPPNVSVCVERLLHSLLRPETLSAAHTEMDTETD